MTREKGMRYKVKATEPRGWSEKLKEPRMMKSFWSVHTMDQVEVMTAEELDIAIDKFIDEFAYRQKKNNKRWDYPPLQLHSRP